MQKVFIFFVNDALCFFNKFSLCPACYTGEYYYSWDIVLREKANQREVTVFNSIAASFNANPANMRNVAIVIGVIDGLDEFIFQGCHCGLIIFSFNALGIPKANAFFGDSNFFKMLSDRLSYSSFYNFFAKDSIN